MTFPPFRKGGLGGISTEYPNPSCTCCTTYCGMLTTQEYAPAGGSFCTDCVCQNPPHSPFTKGGGSKPCNSFPHPQKLTNHYGPHHTTGSASDRPLLRPNPTPESSDNAYAFPLPLWRGLGRGPQFSDYTASSAGLDSPSPCMLKLL